MTEAERDTIDRVARAIYAAECATDLIDADLQPDWGRGGYKTMVFRYEAMARAALAAIEAGAHREGEGK